ncbi:hypothetical protein [Streptomyces canus]
MAIDSYWILRVALTGMGFGFALLPAMTGALATLPADRAGSGSAAC